MDIFDAHMPTPNQLSHPGPANPVSASDLITLSGVKITITPEGLATNIDIGLGYLEAWLRGNGCVPLHNLVTNSTLGIES